MNDSWFFQQHFENPVNFRENLTQLSLIILPNHMYQSDPSGWESETIRRSINSNLHSSLLLVIMKKGNLKKNGYAFLPEKNIIP
jgi:hypothetical protein